MQFDPSTARPFDPATAKPVAAPSNAAAFDPSTAKPVPTAEQAERDVGLINQNWRQADKPSELQNELLDAFTATSLNNNPVVGAGEAALSAVETVPRMVAGGYAGLLEAAKNAAGLPAGNPADMVQQVENGPLFYEPHTKSGKAMNNLIATPFEALHKYVAEPAGGAVAGVAGPAGGTAVSTAIDFLPFLIPGGERGGRPVEPAARVPVEAVPRPSVRKRIADVLDPERRNAEREAMTDPLTGLANRRAFDRALPAAEKDPNTAIALFDVRGLKAANDLVGAEKGDAVIRKAADAVRQATEEVTGSPGRVFRHGGDEVASIVPKDQAAQVIARAKELMGEEDVGGFPVGLRGAVGATAAEADAGVRAAKAAEAGPKYRTAKPGAGATEAEAGKTEKEGAIPQQSMSEQSPRPIELSTGELADAEAPVARKTVRERARELFSGRTYTTADGDNVLVPWQGIKHGTQNADSRALAAMLHIDDLIESARRVRTEPDSAGRGNIKAVHQYEAPVTIDGRPAQARLYVREHLDGSRYYDHAVIEKSEPSGIPGEGTDNGAQSLQPAEGSEKSVANPARAFEPPPADLDKGGLAGVPAGEPGIAIEPNEGDSGRNTRIVMRDRSGEPIGVLKIPTTADGKVDTASKDGALVYVAEGRRRQGIATKLYDAAENAGYDVHKITGKSAITPEGKAFTAARNARQPMRSVEPPPKENAPQYSRQNMQPGANYVGLNAEHAIPEVEPKPGRPITRQDVLRPFVKALGVRLYEGRMKGKNTLGFYLPKKEAVRIKKKGDLEVAAHELAHLIDDREPEIGHSWRSDQYEKPADKKLARQRRDELKGVSYDQKNTKEGFAEFVRLWMTQPEEAAKRAPTYNAWFNDFVQRSKYGPALRDARTSMQDWYHQSDLQRAKSKIGVTKPINAALDGLWDRFRQAVADDLHGVYRMERELKGGIEHGGQYETARLTRAAYTIAERAFLDGAPKKLADGTTRFVGKGLQQILDPVAAELDNFLLYAIGRSAGELKMQGRENLFSTTEIRAMRQLETPEFKQAFDDYQAWNKAVVDFAQAHGIINPESRKLWQRAQYLPMYRVDETVGGRRAKGIEGNWNGIHRLTGGTGNLNDMLGNIMQNASRLIVDAIKNEARQDVADLADQQRGGGRFMVKIARDTKPISVDKAQIRDFVYGMLGLRKADVDAGMVPKEAQDAIIALERQFAEYPDFIQFWMHGQAPKGDNVVAVMRNGKPDFYEVADPLLYRAISSLNRPARHWIVTVLSYPKRIGQASVTLTVDFMLRNIARDTLMAGIMSKSGFRPILDSLSGMKSRIARDPAYKEAMANGVGLSSMMRDEKAFRKHLERFYSKKKLNPHYILDAPDKVVYALETIAEAFETSTRYGEYKRARAKGATPKEAAYQAREVSTDFAMRGDSQVLGFMYDTVMFLKPMVNSMDRLYRGVAHDEQRFSIAAKTAILATASAALYLYNRGIQEYQDLPDWDKDTYWHFFVPDGKGGYYHYRMPKLWEIGAISSLAERTTEHLVEKNPDHPLWLDTARIIGNLFYVNGIPQGLAPLYEIATNKNSFTGAPIESQSAQSLAPWARSNAYTPETLVKLGQLERHLPRSLQVSPDKMNALLRGYFNTWATYALSLSDAALFDGKPSLRMDQYPVIKSFYEGSPARHTKYENQFYDMLQQATEARRTFNAMAKQGQNEIAGELANSPDQAAYTSLSGANRQLQAIHRAMNAVRDDPNLSPDDKRAQIDKLTRERDELMKEAVEGTKKMEASAQ